MKYKVPAVCVLHVKEMFERKHVSGVGNEAIFADESIGWYIWLEGSYESICVGQQKPELQVGDRVNITIERI